MKTRANKAVVKVALGTLAANAAFPALAFASEEESGGLSAILPDMAEFIPMLIAFIILWIILAKFGWPMFAGMLEKRESTIREALKKYLPVKVRRRRNKMGYPAPFFRWLRESDEKEQFKEIIFSFAARNIVPAETIKAHYHAHMSGKANMEQLLFRYLTLELWLRTCNFDKIPDCAEVSR